MAEGGEQLEVWWASVEAVPAATVDAWAERLDEPTRAAAGRLLRPADRARSVLAHALARSVVGARIGVPPASLTLTRHCAACQEDGHGKPAFVGAGMPAISLSHAGPLAVVAVGAPGTELGVDIELAGRGDWALIRRHTFTDAEWQASSRTSDPDAARLTLWAIKEAAAKATGHGLELGLARVATPASALAAASSATWHAATISGEQPQPLAGQTVACTMLPAPLAPDAALAVAVLGRTPTELPTLRDGTALLAAT